MDEPLHPSRMELLAAIEDWHSGGMSESAAYRFKELLRNDIHACQTFVEYGDMLMCLSLEAGNDTSHRVDSRIADTLSTSRHRPVRRYRLAAGALASVGLSLVILVPLLWRSNGVSTLASGPVAVIVSACSRAGNSVTGVPTPLSSALLQPGNRLSAAEIITLRDASEFVELTFASSAQVLLQGPARLVMESGNSARLDWGRLLGTVPPAAVGFTLKVPDGVVQDLGTEFAVDATTARTDVSVLVGEVLCEWKTADSAPVSTRLQRGESVQVAAGTTTFLRLESPPESIAALTGFRTTVTGSSGEFEQMSGPPPLPSQAVPPRTAAARLYPERADVAFTWDAANRELIPQGVVTDESQMSLRMNQVSPVMDAVPQGTSLQVDSCLVVVRAPDRKTTIVRGSVTFDREIIGLISETKLLGESDGLLGYPEFAADWQAHPNRSRGSNESADVLEISEDGRTLTYTLQASGAVDELRILVRSREPVQTGGAAGNSMPTSF